MHGLLPHLASIVQASRLAAGVTVTEIATVARVDPSTVYRFERGRAWPRDPDVMIDAYISECGGDPLDLWGRSLEQWRSTR